jgi:hypothetical protein
MVSTRPSWFSFSTSTSADIFAVDHLKRGNAKHGQYRGKAIEANSRHTRGMIQVGERHSHPELLERDFSVVLYGEQQTFPLLIRT